ncbi:MAG: FHA domain-containing protein, partial [Planctomycetes bacterium]|nr:FHA domain-containing protein [Planctomycetota bacterium]
MATVAKAQAERSITTATQRIKLSVTAQLPTGESKSWSLLKPVTVIGSRRHAQIIVREEHVNRSHAAIVNTGVHVLLVDLLSDGGTYCNGRLVTRELLKDGDVVRVGSTDLRISIELPPKWTLIARDAFNGVVLWKQPIPTWQNHLWPLKSGPTQMARRLVATSDTVYVTLGFREPVTAIDAATGKKIRSYEETKPTEEFILSQGVLLTLVNQHESELTKYAPQLNLGDQGRLARE